MKISHVRKSTVLPMALPAAVVSAQPVIITDSGIKTEWVKISPELATKWLEEHNTNNRTVRDVYVSRLASDMASGKWLGRNGEAIRFDTSGRLVDGQHRLWACVQSGVSFESVVMWGVDPETYKTIGTGRPKSFADFLGPIHGEKSVHLYAAAIRLVYFWSKGVLGSMEDGTQFPTITDLEIMYKDHPMLAESVSTVGSKPATRLTNPSYIVLIHYAGYCAGMPATALDFIDRLGTGLALLEDDPIYQLRSKLLAERGPIQGRKRHTKKTILAFIIKAWNYHKEGKRTKDMRFRAGEEFPTL